LNDRQFKGVVSFDTSAISDNAVIVSATVRLRRAGVFGSYPFQTHGTCRIEVGAVFGSSVDLQPSDFEAPAAVMGAGVLGAAAANGQWSEGSLAASGLGAINRQGDHVAPHCVPPERRFRRSGSGRRV
jgi:hypothetical protein